MDLPPISGIRGDSLATPRRTERIVAVDFEVAATASAEDEGSSSRRHAQERGLDYEDAEFIEITEENEAAPVAAAPRGGRHVHFVA